MTINSDNNVIKEKDVKWQKRFVIYVEELKVRQVKCFIYHPV